MRVCVILTGEWREEKIQILSIKYLIFYFPRCNETKEMAGGRAHNISGGQLAMLVLAIECALI